MKQTLLHWLTGGAAAMVLSAAARALPKPQKMGSRFYRWFYRFSQNLLVNWDLSKNEKVR